MKGDNMNERVREVRKKLGLTLEKFGSQLGVSKVAISRIENGINNVTEQMCKSICREYNVNEVWLRTGEGEMHIELPEDAEFDLIMTEIQESDDDLIKSILKAYWELPDTKKAAVKDWLDGVIKNLGKEKAGK